MDGRREICSLLKDGVIYNPDTFDLSRDTKAAEYWFQCLREMVEKFTSQAAASQCDDKTTVKRAEQFRQMYLQKLDENERAMSNEGNMSLGTRELLELNEKLLRRFGFSDPWLKQKELENSAAIALLHARLREVDAIENISERWTELVSGVLAGNMFDWGAQAVSDILEKEKTFGLHSALERIQRRPWLIDDLDAWLQRMQSQPHQCCVIFVDNSGVDIVLGILPFVRELLKRGTKVLLCANAAPSLNDVTCYELQNIIAISSNYCNILATARTMQQLIIYDNGQYGPCLDMRMLPSDLCQAIVANKTDLLVIEGMGRALHTNLNAKFNCETLKIAVIKNKWMANRLGGDTFAVMCKYER